jgi:hypothetical protein
MFVSIRDHKTYREYYSVSFNNQNYIPPIPRAGDRILIHPETPTISRRCHVIYCDFHFDELGLTGVTLNVAEDREVA